MKTSVCLSLAACGLLAIVSSGCGSASTVARGQEPMSDPFVRPVSHGTQPHLWEAVTDHGTRVDHYEVPMNAPANTHYTANSPYYGPAASCPPSAECPHCQGTPAYGTTCPFCQSADPHGHSGLGHLHNHVRQHMNGQYPQHHFTYGYKRPTNLVYPPPQVPGGAVMYPYYTLKGPSDFFRAE